MIFSIINLLICIGFWIIFWTRKNNPRDSTIFNLVAIMLLTWFLMNGIYVCIKDIIHLIVQ